MIRLRIAGPSLANRRQRDYARAAPGNRGGMKSAYLIASGFSGLPTALVKRSGGATKKQV